MSEHQHYAFRAIDRALTPAQIQESRALSTRARITSTSFVNDYQWGSFKGDPRKLMERYFDFHCYFANWGTRILMLRLPRRLVDLAVAAPYVKGHWLEPWTLGEHLFLAITSDEEPEYDEILLSALRFHQLATQGPHEAWLAIHREARSVELRLWAGPRRGRCHAGHAGRHDGARGAAGGVAGWLRRPHPCARQAAAYAAGDRPISALKSLMKWAWSK